MVVHQLSNNAAQRAGERLLMLLSAGSSCEHAPEEAAWPHSDDEWADVVHMATRHKVIPQLYAAVTRTRRRAVPECVIGNLRRRTQIIAVKNEYLTKELIRVMELFDAAAIRAIPFKGPMMAAALYGGTDQRQFGDLDVLVGQRDYYLEARDLLLRHGWKPRVDFGWECSFSRAGGTVILDLHRTITHHSVPFRCGFRRFWKRAQLSCVSGATLRTLSPADLLMVSCLQITKDVRGRNMQLQKICDVAAYVRVNADLDWSAVLREARRCGVLHIVLLGLASAHEFLGAELPFVVHQHLLNAPQLAPLVTHIRELMFKTDALDFSHPELLDGDRFHAETREHRRNRRGRTHWWSPGPNDYRWVCLPRELNWIYYIVRPVRAIHRIARRAMPEEV